MSLGIPVRLNGVLNEPHELGVYGSPVTLGLAFDLGVEIVRDAEGRLCHRGSVPL